MMFFPFRINDYIKNGQDKIVDPTPNSLYIKGKNLKDEKTQDRDLATADPSPKNMCMKGNLSISCSTYQLSMKHLKHTGLIETYRFDG